MTGSDKWEAEGQHADTHRDEESGVGRAERERLGTKGACRVCAATGAEGLHHPQRSGLPA